MFECYRKQIDGASTEELSLLTDRESFQTDNILVPNMKMMIPLLFGIWFSFLVYWIAFHFQLYSIIEQTPN